MGITMIIIPILKMKKSMCTNTTSDSERSQVEIK